MELNDAFGRIVGQHWRLLTAGLVAGVMLGLVLGPHGTEYAASARLVLDTPDPVARQQSVAYADTAKAIATSPAQVRAALRSVGVVRGDPAVFAKNHVAVTALGTSGVIQLTVTDRKSKAAAAVANSLVSLVIRTRVQVTDGELNHIFAQLDRRTAALNKKIADAADYVNALSDRIAAAGSADAAASLREKRQVAQSSLDFLAQQRSVLQAQRVSLLSATAQRPRPAIISAATPPRSPESSHLTLYAVLGALLGLIFAIGAAGFLETIRPTLVGGETLAGELDAPLLGRLDDPVEQAAADIGARLRLAAEAAQVRNVALVAAGTDVDLGILAEWLRSAPAAGGFPAPLNSKAKGHAALRIGPFDAESPPFNNGVRSGIVVVSPTALKKNELTDIAHLLKVSRLPLLGLITHTPPESGLLHEVKSRLDVLKGERR